VVIRSRKSKKDRQHNGQKFKDTKGVIRSCKSKDRQQNGQKFEDTKGVIRSVNQRRTDNIMVKSLKNDRQHNSQKESDYPFGIFKLLTILLSVLL
jgi:uncharacterized protein involved in type VI secretion and phage assembly